MSSLALSLTAHQREVVIRAFVPRKLSRGEVIYRQGERGTAFAVVHEGIVRCEKDGVVVLTLGEGGLVGERSLLHDEPRACDVIVESEVCHIAELDREIFERHLGRSVAAVVEEQVIVGGVHLEDLLPEAELQSNAYSSTHVVRHRRTRRLYCLKVVNKQRATRLQQRSRVTQEKAVLSLLDNPFVVGLVAAFQTKEDVCLLTEVCQGGDLLQRMARVGRFREDAAVFYAANVVLGLDYLHTSKVVCRDLRPETLGIDEDGYVKFTDFASAKRGVERSHTLIGMPEYLAPEVIRNQGHDKAVDWWAFGVLVFEMLAGKPRTSPPLGSMLRLHSCPNASPLVPAFLGSDIVETYSNILRREFEFPPHMSSAVKVRWARTARSGPDISRGASALPRAGADIQAACPEPPQAPRNAPRWSIGRARPRVVCWLRL